MTTTHNTITLTFKPGENDLDAVEGVSEKDESRCGV